MKKLVLTMAIVCLATISQAASFKWSATNIMDGSGTSTAMASGAAYIFCVADISQLDLYNAIAQDGLAALTAKCASSMDIADGKIAVANSTFDYGASGSKYDYYFAIFDAEHNQVYFSNIKKDQVGKVSPQITSVLFGSQATGSDKFSTGTGYQGAGSWSAVPEPTGAMLIVLGVAALALRRKRA